MSPKRSRRKAAASRERKARPQATKSRQPPKSRTPPKAVRQQLRREVGFGCPVPGCGSPYLRWHHFDPPWSIRPHHNPEGMVALCDEHHPKADHRAFRPDQLRQFKRVGRDRTKDLGGRFDWMRDQLVALVGGNVYFETPVVLQVGDRPVISFERDKDENLLLSLNMITMSGEPRMVIEDNFWIETGEPDDVECPPRGTLVEARYRNGDLLRVEFSESDSREALIARHPPTASLLDFADHEHPGEIEFPLAVVEVHMRVVGPDAEPVIDLGPRETTIAPGFIVTGGVFFRNAVGFHLG